MAPNDRYTSFAIALHWLLGLLIVGAFILGVYMAGLPFSPARIRLFNYHKWLGITVLLLSACRLLWRLLHRPPAMPAAMPRWQTALAQGAHFLLYVLFFTVPLVGWAYSSASGFSIVWLGLVPLPDWIGKDQALALKSVHGRLAYLLAAVVVLHVLAALKHYFLDKDQLLARMLPWQPSSTRLQRKQP